MYKVTSIIIPFLQKREVKHREFNLLQITQLINGKCMIQTLSLAAEPALPTSVLVPLHMRIPCSLFSNIILFISVCDSEVAL